MYCRVPQDCSQVCSSVVFATLLRKMPVISKYSHVKVKDRHAAQHVTLTALRVIGKAVEEGHKQVRDEGCPAFLAKVLQTLTFKGQLQVKSEDGILQNRRVCTLELRPESLVGSATFVFAVSC